MEIDQASGGDSAFVADQLESGVKEVVATEAAFAALKDDGSVKAWGSVSYGGCDSGTNAHYTCKPTGLTGVTDIFSTKVTFSSRI